MNGPSNINAVSSLLQKTYPCGYCAMWNESQNI